MITLNQVQFRIVSTLAADGWQACFESDGQVLRQGLTVWATIEAVTRWDGRARCYRPIHLDEQDSRVVGLSVTDGVLECDEECSNFLGYCRAADTASGYEDEATTRASERGLHAVSGTA